MDEKPFYRHANTKTTQTNIVTEKTQTIHPPPPPIYTYLVYNYVNKVIDGDGEEFTETADILNCQIKFYKKLYNEEKLQDIVSILSSLGENSDAIYIIIVK